MKMNENMMNKLLNEEKSFENDLSIVDHEYQLWGKLITEDQGKLIEELKYAIGEHREDIIKELQRIEKLVLEWNSLVEFIIRKYSKEEKYVRQLENYMYQPQR